MDGLNLPIPKYVIIAGSTIGVAGLLYWIIDKILEYEVQHIWERLKDVLLSLIGHKKTIYYDSRRNCKRSDFRGIGGQVWSNSENQSVGPIGQGELTVETGGILSVERTNKEGRFEVWLRQYKYDNVESEYLPERPLITGTRNIRLTCEAKVTDGKHTLLFLFKDRITDKSPDPPKEEVISSNEWNAIDLTFLLSPKATYHLRIDDQKVSQVPSTLQIRNLKVWERT